MTSGFWSWKLKIEWRFITSHWVRNVKARRGWCQVDTMPALQAMCSLIEWCTNTWCSYGKHVTGKYIYYYIHSTRHVSKILFKCLFQDELSCSNTISLARYGLYQFNSQYLSWHILQSSKLPKLYWKTNGFSVLVCSYRSHCAGNPYTLPLVNHNQRQLYGTSVLNCKFFFCSRWWDAQPDA